MSEDPDTRPPSTTTVQYPSADFPPIPTFRLSVPDDWVAVPSMQKVMVLQAAQASAGFRANVVVGASRVSPPADPAAELAAAVDADLDRSGYELVKRMESNVGGTPAMAVDVRFTTGDSVAVEAHQLLVYVPGSDRSSHVVTITGSVAAAAPSSEREAVRATVLSFQLPEDATRPG